MSFGIGTDEEHVDTLKLPLLVKTEVAIREGNIDYVFSNENPHATHRYY